MSLVSITVDSMLVKHERTIDTFNSIRILYIFAVVIYFSSKQKFYQNRGYKNDSNMYTLERRKSARIFNIIKNGKRRADIESWFTSLTDCFGSRIYIIFLYLSSLSV